MEKEKINLNFEELDDMTTVGYSAGCSGGRSYCCTRECTRVMKDDGSGPAPDSLQAWDEYFHEVSGVIQY